MSRLTLLVMLDGTLMLAAMAFVGLVMKIAYSAAGAGEPRQPRTLAPATARSPRRAYVPATSQG
jgi:hypothetical protein